MKKYKIDLQFFAEDTEATDSATAEKAETGTQAAAETDKEVKEPKAAKSQLKYSDDDLDKILNQKFAKWQQQQQKAVDEAKKLGEMNATQKAEYQRDQLQKELDALKKKDALAEMMKTSRKILSEGGISVSDELLSVMVTTDAEETQAAIGGFAIAFKEAVEAEVKARLKGEPPRRGTGNAPTMTKEQIQAIRDPELRQKKMLEHRELFNF